MGKLAIMSDLHVDINQLDERDLTELVTVLKKQNITRLHLAGDTANDVARVLSVIEFIEQAGILVTFNFGNHELPQLSPQEMEDYPDPHFLNQDFIELNSELVLLGVNGWYDYSFGSDQSDANHLRAKNLYWYDRLIEREASDLEVTTQILNRLETVLEELSQTDKKIVVATHFVPRGEFIVTHKGRYARWNQLNAFLGSERMGDLLANYPQIKHVVFGHTHRQFNESVIGGITYSARPFGYFYEWHLTRDFMLNRNLMSAFNPMKVRGILKEYQVEFDAYRRRHLHEEFQRSLTVFNF